MQAVLDFFRHLPKKVCISCGVEMDEQSDCYVNQCHECTPDVYYPRRPIAG
ncbi:MAG: YhfH family protein [Bacillaceae bacterium]|nr:YhfH family protein [Bacillaceae bacterium]